MVEYGSCEIEYGPTFPWAALHSGDWLVYGGDEGAVASCRAWQEVDLLGEGFLAATLDAGLATVNAEAWLRSWANAGSFDDQVFYRVRLLDPAGGFTTRRAAWYGLAPWDVQGRRGWRFG